MKTLWLTALLLIVVAPIRAEPPPTEHFIVGDPDGAYVQILREGGRP